MRATWAATATISLCLTLAGLPAAAQSPPAPLLATPTLVRYEDPVGDLRDGMGPDIVAVTVSQPDPTGVTIAVEFATAPPLGYDMVEDYTDMMGILIDTDLVEDDDPWYDFVTWVHGYDLQETVAHGAPLADYRPSPGSLGVVAVAVEGATLSLTLTRESLGDPERMLFLVSVAREGETPNDGYDEFPDNPEGEGWTTFAAWTFPTG